MTMTDGAAVAAAEDDDVRDDVDVDEGEVSQADIEAKARRMGWRPRDEYRGPPEKWVSAEDYLERAETEFPVLQNRYNQLDAKTAKLERDNKELADKVSDASRALQEIHAQNERIKKEAYERARRDIKAEMRKAAEEGDPDAYAKKEAELEALEKEPPATTEKPAETTTDDQSGKKGGLHPAVAQWISENDWYDSHVSMKALANAEHSRLLKEEPGLTIEQNLAKVRAEVVRRFPEHFGNPRRDAPGAVGSPSDPPGTRRRNGGPTYDALSKEDKAECDRFIKTYNATNPKVPMTRERWVKDYFEQE